MKTISVKQVAAALELTPRAVIYRLEKGQLKGTQTPNAFGKHEWRVYPTKEIIEGLKKLEGRAGQRESDDRGIDFSPTEIETNIETEFEDNDVFIQASPPEDAWRDSAKEALKGLAEELVRPLVETIQDQQSLIAEKDRIIWEKDRQLRLLPDLEKQALEAEALRKQIVALEQEKEKKEAEAIEATRVAEELKLQSDELEQKLAAEAEEKQKVDEQLQAMKNQLEALTAKVERSWWKKFFGVE